MRRSRAVVTLAALAVIALTARLGVWQLDRGAQKRALEADMLARRDLPALTAESLARSAEAAALQHHRAIRLVGQWSGTHTVYLENRTQGGRTGFIVVTPLVLADGTGVAVQRGWLPRDPADRTKVQAPAPPEGPQVLDGRIAPPPSRLYDFQEQATGRIRQNLDLVEWSRETGLALRPLSVMQTAPAAVDGLSREWPQPAADVHKHYGYAFQWFALSALTLILYVWFQILRPRRLAARTD